MSLIMSALSVCLVKALKGKSFAEDRVLESDPDALVETLNGALEIKQPGPFVNVFVQGAKATVGGQSLLRENGDVEIIFEMGVNAQMTISDPETGEGRLTMVDLVPSTANMDRLLGLMWSQITNAIEDQSNEWADLVRSLVVGLDAGEIVRMGVVSTAGQRLAARQIKLTVRALSEPQADNWDEQGAPFGRYVAAVEQSGDNVLAGQIRTILGNGDLIWSDYAGQQGWGPDQLSAVGLGPADPDNPDAVLQEDDISVTVTRDLPDDQ